MRNREYQPEYRKRKQELEQKQRKEIANRAVILGKWLWVLFWLQISLLIIGFMPIKYVQNVSPSLYRAVLIISAVCGIAYGAILCVLLSVDKRYCIAGICRLIVAAIGVLAWTLISADDKASLITLTILAVGVSIVSIYYEWRAHSSVLVNVDDDLSEKWAKLMKGFIYSILGMVLGLFLGWPFGTIVVLGAAIVFCIKAITVYVYLYQTAKVFREYPVDKT